LVDVTDNGSVLVTTVVENPLVVGETELALLAEEVAEADGTTVRVVVVVMMAVSVEVVPAATVVDV
jgi:hypothetical protein